MKKDTRMIGSRALWLRAAWALTLALQTTSGFASYLCSGQVGYLGIGASGDVTISLANSTPIHYVCSVSAQGSYGINVASCKASYAAILAARLSGKTIVIYYGDNGMTCGTLPSWGAVPSAYFIQGPD
jgi:hypothetical protein